MSQMVWEPNACSDDLSVGKLDYLSHSIACSGFLPRFCFGGQNKPFVGLEDKTNPWHSPEIPRNCLEGEWYGPVILRLNLAIMLEKKKYFYVLIRQLKSIPDSPLTPLLKRYVPSPRPTWLFFTLSAPHIILTLKFTG